MTGTISLPNNRGRLLLVEDADELARVAAETFVEAVGETVTRRGDALVALSGGSTPKQMGRLLAAPPFSTETPWSNLTVFWSDERWVPLDSRDSNAGVAIRIFLDHVPVPRSHIHPVDTMLPSPADAAAAYAATIHAATGALEPAVPAFDLILLGMGDDAHTASLFPHTPALRVADRIVTDNFVTKLDAQRITFTYPLINAARRVVFLIGGAAKAEPLAEVLEGPEDVDRLPAQGVRPVGDLLWIVDRAAAARLSVIR
ncbi:MAG: 6-phosphogluconolactonase [Thermomicrobiales bacterium]|nr:6-phosphogluconolactonase [Thermomicrobiales bacterium]